MARYCCQRRSLHRFRSSARQCEGVADRIFLSALQREEGGKARSGEPPEEATLIALAVILGSLLIVALAELLRPRRRREFPALRRRLGNLGIWVFNVVLAAFVFGSPATFRTQLEAAFGLALPSWPIADAGASFIAAFLLLDLLQYAVHRCQHAAPFLWRFHALHHSDPDVDVTTSVRHHPVEYLIAAGIYWMAALALDIPAIVVVSHAVAVFAAASITHGNIRLPEWLERWLQPMLITIDLHRIHHSVSAAEANSNFGAVLSIWDRLFGTYAWIPRAQQERILFGVHELARVDGVRPSAMILTPWLLRRGAAGARD
jgi:sterol desaturase/sphingolipid hydroxylase (fatty acid hydroxylase superfamily)